MHLPFPLRTHLALMAALVFGATAWATPLLRCEVTYAGSAHVLEATPVTDPYPVPAVDIGGRFWFKPVMVGQGSRVDYVKLYAYLDTRQQPLLIHEAIHLPPFQTGETAYPLTGTHHLYAGPVERELIYSCTLQGVQP
ncbi:hypothetical protein [Rhodoferax fermentans]|nr:hypothetical protein [Rhodoferax fermentans]